GITIVLITHESDIAAYASRVLTLRDGRLLRDEPVLSPRDAKLAQALTEDDATAVAREIPAVQVAAPSLKGKAQVVSGNLNWSTDIYGVTEDYLEARDWPLVAGRFLGPEDVVGATKVAVLGQTTALNLFGDADPLGQIVRIQKVPFTVIGLLDEKGESSYGW